MTAYYNEFNPFAAAWLRELIKAGHIPAGEVDERDIREVQPDDLRGFTQHHFFAGIGGWAYAARLAGWPDDRPLFTGSPPCQPFSGAGKQLGVKDDRHLTPHWLELVRTVRPPFVAGEQVSAAVNKDAWLDDLLDALEAENYTTGAIVLPACSVGAPHIRQRIFFVGRMGDTTSVGQYRGFEDKTRKQSEMLGEGHEPVYSEQPVSVNTHETGWDSPDWIFCRDGKWRAVESSTFPLANGIPNRVGRLRGYGNAIVPQVAAEVLKELM